MYVKCITIKTVDVFGVILVQDHTRIGLVLNLLF